MKYSILVPAKQVGLCLSKIARLRWFKARIFSSGALANRISVGLLGIAMLDKRLRIVSEAAAVLVQAAAMAGGWWQVHRNRRYTVSTAGATGTGGCTLNRGKNVFNNELVHVLDAYISVYNPFACPSGYNRGYIESCRVKADIARIFSIRQDVIRNLATA